MKVLTGLVYTEMFLLSVCALLGFYDCVVWYTLTFTSLNDD